MPEGDTYTSFAELVRNTQEGKDFRRVIEWRRSCVAIVAPHGGGIEPGTSEVARALAGDKFALYCFEGLRPNGNDELHVTSHCFDDPACIQLVEQMQVVVAVHGCAGEDKAVYVGGLDDGLKSRLIQTLQRTGFRAGPSSGELAGCYVDNICNRGRLGQGVQLEITEGLRRAMFADLTWKGRETRTPVLGWFVEAVRRELERGFQDNSGCRLQTVEFQDNSGCRLQTVEGKGEFQVSDFDYAP